MSKLYKRGQYYYVRFRPAPGEKFQWRSLKTKNKKVAQSKRSRIDRSLRARVLLLNPGRPVSLSFERLKAAYEEWASIQRDADTIYQTKNAIDKFVATTKVTHVAQVTSQHIEKYKREQLARTSTTHKEKKISGVTVNKDLRTLRAAVNIAIDPLKIYDRVNPFQKFKPLPQLKKLPRYLTAQQIGAVMRCAQGHSRNMHLFFALGIYAGLRLEEIIECQWEWIDFKARKVRVQQTLFWKPKDRDERAVDLSDTLMDILKQHRDRVSGYIIEPENAPKESGYRYNVRKPFKSVTTAAELTWCTAKCLRSTFASQLAIHGAELWYIQGQLGHEDPETTMIYAALVSKPEYVNRIPKPLQP